MGGLLSSAPNPPRQVNNPYGVRVATPSYGYKPDATARVAPRVSYTYSPATSTAAAASRTDPWAQQREVQLIPTTQPTPIKQEKKILRKVECPKCSHSWSAQEWVYETDTICKSEKCKFQFKLYPINKEYPKGKGLTPYQGPDRQEGEFRCSNCNKYWKSVNSWADMGQDCMKCKILVMPHTQKISPDFGSAKCNPHPKELCERCKKLGYFCGKNDLKKYIRSKDDVQ